MRIALAGHADDHVGNGDYPSDKAIIGDMVCPVRPYQVVSLWDMLEFYGGHFVSTIRLLIDLKGRPLPPGPSPELRTIAATNQASHPNHSRAKEVLAMIDDAVQSKKEFVLKVLALVSEQCEELGLRQAVRKLQELKRDLAYRDLADQDIDEVLSRIEHELHDVKCFCLPVKNAPYYDSMLAGWSAVANKHPSLFAGIDEAGKCLALGRYTASVFHLMRVMERGVQLLGKKLTVTGTHDKQWQNIIDEIVKQIERKWPSKGASLTSSQKKRRQRYNESVALLTSVKLAWRNEVMHPKDTYTEEEAINVYLASRAFMTHLVTLT